jgi:hypothetical protein
MFGAPLELKDAGLMQGEHRSDRKVILNKNQEKEMKG